MGFYIIQFGITVTLFRITYDVIIVWYKGCTM